MTGPLTFTLQTRTPLWTGGVEPGKMDRIHETGIIGSLRWWYEVTLRALGLDICDPTSDDPSDRCPRADQHYCDVCQLFGATGRSRRFRVQLGSGDRLFQSNNILLPSGRPHNNRLGGWYLQAESRIGGLPMCILPLGPVDEVSKLRIPLALVHNHSALGAKVSNGYGVVNVTEENGAQIAVDPSMLGQLLGGSSSQMSSDLPDLRDFFFAKLKFKAPSNDPYWWQKVQGIAEAFSGHVTVHGQHLQVFRNSHDHNRAKDMLRSVVQQHGIVPLAPAVRNWLRYTWFPSRIQSGRVPGRNELESYLFGRTRRNDNVASKINVSHAYRLGKDEWEFRVWGWIPCEPPQDLSFDRDLFLACLKNLFEGQQTNWRPVFGDATRTNPECTEWHSLDCNSRDGAAYLNSLLGFKSKVGTP